MPSAFIGLQCGYDSLNRRIWLINGWVGSNAVFYYDIDLEIFVDTPASYLPFVITESISAQSYTQIKSTLYFAYNNALQTFDLSIGSIRSPIPFNTIPNKAPCLVSVKNRYILMIGGENQATIPSTGFNYFTIYDTVAELWMNGKDMPRKRRHAACAVLGSYAYVFGGKDKSFDPSIIYVDRIDIQFMSLISKQNWQTGVATLGVTTINTNFAFSRAVVADNLLYLLGGYNSTTETSIDGRIQVMDTNANMYSVPVKMITPRISPAVIVVNNIIYVFGGAINSSEYATNTFEYSNQLTFNPENATLKKQKRYISKKIMATCWHYAINYKYVDCFSLGTKLIYNRLFLVVIILLLFTVVAAVVIHRICKIVSPKQNNIYNNIHTNKHELEEENTLNKDKIIEILDAYQHVLLNSKISKHVIDEKRCDVPECARFARNYRDRDRDKDLGIETRYVSNLYGTDHNQYVAMQQTLDKIHCFYYHKDTKPPKDALENKMCKKYNQLYRNADDTQNKFLFGWQFQYGNSNDESKLVDEDVNCVVVKPKYDNLKDEMIQNDIASLYMEQYMNEYYKAKLHMSSYYRKRFCVGVSNSHILALLIYCNFDHLQTEFSKTYREQKGKKHTYFFYLGKNLKELVIDHGTAVKDGDIESFYHGIHDKLVPIQIVGDLGKGISIYCPLSTSGSFHVAANFTNQNKGIIMTFGGSSMAKYFYAAWLSDFANEDEYLFLQNKQELQIMNIIECNSGTQYEDCLKSLKAIDSILHETHYYQRREGYNMEYIIAIMKNQLSISLSDKKWHPLESLSEYGQELISVYFQNKKTLSIHYSVLEHNYSEIFELVCLKNDCEWLNVEVLSAIFPMINVIEITNIKLCSQIMDFIELSFSENQCLWNLERMVVKLNKVSKLSASSAVSKYKRMLQTNGIIMRIVESVDDHEIITFNKIESPELSTKGLACVIGECSNGDICKNEYGHPNKNNGKQYYCQYDEACRFADACHFNHDYKWSTDSTPKQYICQFWAKGVCGTDANRCRMYHPNGKRSKKATENKKERANHEYYEKSEYYDEDDYYHEQDHNYENYNYYNPRGRNDYNYRGKGRGHYNERYRYNPRGRNDYNRGNGRRQYNRNYYKRAQYKVKRNEGQ
eukprot:527144_1